MLCNYHTHTKRCKHAQGTDEEYVLEAIRNGFDEIGFSDHSPWPLHDGENSRIRMELDEFEDYRQSVLYLKEKYKDQIRIWLGLECEYLEDRMDWLAEFKREKGLDYIILGNHFDNEIVSEKYFGHYRDLDHCLERYAYTTIKGIESGLYLYLAHPDLFMKTYRNWDPRFEELSLKILRKCKEYGMPVEVNLAGVRDSDKWFCGYPCPEFWQLVAQVKNDVVIGLDAHAPQNFQETDIIRKTKDDLEAMGLHVLDRFELLDRKE